VRLGSILAIYSLFWVMSFFLVIPFGMRTDEEAGVESAPGHVESAPHKFSFAKASLRATAVSAVLFGLFYLNYVYGWIGSDQLDWAPAPRT
jgi:predicted secreted protein